MFTADHVPMYIAGKWDGNTLLSVGVVSASGAAFYAEASNFTITPEMSEGKDGKVFLNLMWQHMNRYHSEIEMGGASVFGYESKDPHYHRLMKAHSNVIQEQLHDWLDIEMYNCNGGNGPIVFYTDANIFDQNKILALVSKDEGGKAVIRPHVSDVFMDLNPVLAIRGYGRNFDRDKLIENDDLTRLVRSVTPFCDFESRLSHTALWDAVRIKLCFDHIQCQLGAFIHAPVSTKTIEINDSVGISDVTHITH